MRFVTTLFLIFTIGCESPQPPPQSADAGPLSDTPLAQPEPDAAPIVIAHPPKPAHGPFDDIRPIDLPETPESHDLNDHIKAAPDWYVGTNVIPTTYFTPPESASDEASGTSGVLLCHVDRHGPSMDTHGSEEPMMKWNVGKYRAVTQRNDASYWFSLPGVALKKGQKIAVTVWDQDVTEDELIGRASVTYAGDPAFVAKAKAFDLNCHWYTDLSELEDERYSAADEAMYTFVAALNTIEESWIYPVSEETSFVDALAALAAIVGWADIRVQRLVGWRNALVDRWNLLSTAHFDDLGLQPAEWQRNQAGTFEARLVKFKCRPRAWKIYQRLWRNENESCGGEVEVRNLGRTAVEVDPFFRRGFPEGDFQVHHRKGRPMALRSDTFRYPKGEEPTKLPDGTRRRATSRGFTIEPQKSIIYRLEAAPWILAPEWKKQPGDFFILQVGRGDEAIYLPLH